MQGEVVRYERDETVGVITLDRTKARNAINKAIAVATGIAGGAPLSLTSAKAVARDANRLTEADGLALQARHVKTVFASADMIEGATVSAEKRKPVWAGQ